MFGLNKKEEKAESIKDNTIELQESSSSTAPITGEIITHQHTCDDNCNHSKPVQVQQPPSLTHKDTKSLRNADYNKVSEKFFTAYVIQNTSTGQIVEMRAASPLHACKMIGWRPRKVKVLSERKIEAKA